MTTRPAKASQCAENYQLITLSNQIGAGAHMRDKLWEVLARQYSICYAIAEALRL